MKRISPLIMVLCLGAVGCSGDDDDTKDEQDMSQAVDAGSDEPSTTNVLCAFKDSGSQRLVYLRRDPRTSETEDMDEMTPYAFEWSCSDTERMLSGNGIPNHVVTGGEFASHISEQEVTMTVTLNPFLADQKTTVKQPGYALNSVKFDPGTAGTCPDEATTPEDCNSAAGTDTWRMVATGDESPWKFGFGVDENHAHVQPSGMYHYHGNPIHLVETLNSDYETSMTLIGWANDGFPIYSLYGASDVNDASSSVVKMTSSYRTIDPPPADRPSVEDFALGHFEQDWEYVEGSGTLDECNGRFAATPEFPNGIYHYYTTETYPFVQRCVSGAVEDEMMGGGMMGGGMMGGGMMGDDMMGAGMAGDMGSDMDGI